ncbi:4-(cytidine 5'-diphospho)-2-C-methyl-D-erythritol kinase [Flavihumibacter petaseus]|uniref:4-diphosphocytidyl-2-C-methyl-D-erythritol kinase n=1 Tax=Flavihumibacter petaseus NBRC 106054 TaxID=1220578 RepID=A0A0E9N1M3_9BACT|nr:4-(cytidine 5'-diphospho)-2-C-methyl-D-erythritol kinase [Flavihumibacter petaseus]GAO43678.1 4-diphosphocytidyl-2-C-methyl-D-erythritol kinase [Flavihumibacter petaseus NBRC 106054]
MIVFPNAKINLGLRVMAKRPDGYHNLETIFYPIPLCDVLEGIRAEKPAFTLSGVPVDGPPEKNLCIRALKLLSKDFDIPAISFHLHKNIPLGAGMGGGSADATFTLKLISELCRIDLTPQQLKEYALQIGSDCPFFLLNQPALGTGRGELLEPVSIPALSGKKLLVVYPGIHINTAWAFSQVQPSGSATAWNTILSAEPDSWNGMLVNDFEAPVLAAYPELLTLKTTLLSSGAVFAGMSGSGSTFYGIYNELPPAAHRLFPPEYRIWEFPIL